MVLIFALILTTFGSFFLLDRW